MRRLRRFLLVALFGVSLGTLGGGVAVVAVQSVASATGGSCTVLLYPTITGNNGSNSNPNPTGTIWQIQCSGIDSAAIGIKAHWLVTGQGSWVAEVEVSSGSLPSSFTETFQNSGTTGVSQDCVDGYCSLPSGYASGALVQSSSGTMNGYYNEFGAFGYASALSCGSASPYCGTTAELDNTTGASASPLGGMWLYPGGGTTPTTTTTSSTTTTTSSTTTTTSSTTTTTSSTTTTTTAPVSIPSAFPVQLSAMGFFMIGLGFVLGALAMWIQRIWR